MVNKTNKYWSRDIDYSDFISYIIALKKKSFYFFHLQDTNTCMPRATFRYSSLEEGKILKNG